MAFYTGHETLYNYITQPIPDGVHTFQTVAEGKAVGIDVEFYNFYDDVDYTENPVLGDTVADTKMLILKYHKNLHIGQAVTMTPQVAKKGMLVYVMGNLHNEGKISMTARGSNAAGQNVYLWKNSDGTFEYVPANGANGAGYVRTSTTSNASSTSGSKGGNAVGRATGGGGSGAASKPSSTYSMYCQSGNGGAGTSYSGGGGGGAVYSYNSGGSVVAGSASGVRGGNAASFDSRYDATGGVGTPNGGSAGGATLLTSGTGGLLIIYCDGELNIAYNSVIDSQGVRNTIGTSGITGGSSGGGSVNIFHVAKLTNNGTVTSTGGATGNGSVLGGAGGNGTVTLQQVTLKQNQVRFLNEDSKPIGQMDLGYAIQGAYGKVAKFTAESVYLLPIKTLKLSWKHAHDSVTTEPILEFSKTLDPFVPENPLIFTETLGYRERVEFYVRAKSGEMQTEQGRFEITAEIEGA